VELNKTRLDYDFGKYRQKPDMTKPGKREPDAWREVRIFALN